MSREGKTWSFPLGTHLEVANITSALIQWPQNDTNLAANNAGKMWSLFGAATYPGLI